MCQHKFMQLHAFAFVYKRGKEAFFRHTVFHYIDMATRSNDKAKMNQTKVV